LNGSIEGVDRGERRAQGPFSGELDVDSAQRGQRRVRGKEGASLDVVIDRVAARQDGMASRADLVGAGVTRDAIDRRVASGRLKRRYRGVYQVGQGPPTDRGRARAALLAAGPGAALNLHAAAWALNLSPSLPAEVDVLYPGRPRRRQPGLIPHETKIPARIVMAKGFPCTDIERTLKDLGWQGPTRSELERRFLALVTKADLPRPLVNRHVVSMEVDFTWEQELVVIETDGYEYHRARFEADRAKDQRLAAQGYLVIRVTWRQLRNEPLRTAALLAQTLATRRSPQPRARAAA
jgi:very-short-patch-repair endonuclease